MKSIFLINALVALSLAAYAGNEGKGGDGVILKNGQVVLYDLYESDIDANKVFETIGKKSQTNFSMGYELENNRGSVLPAPFATPEIVKKVTELLDWTSNSSPEFARLILEEIKKLNWRQASEDLNPNLDTKPLIPLKDVTRIGCAHNSSEQILVSPSCFGPKMDAANKVALIFHEAIYNLYKRIFPETDNSINVRSLVVAIFNMKPYMMLGSANDDGKFARMLDQVGLNEISVIDEGIRPLMWAIKPSSFGVRCDFDSDVIKSVVVALDGPYEVHGQIQFIRAEDNEEVTANITGYGTSPDRSSWKVTSIPRYDLEAREIIFETNYGDELFKLKIHNGLAHLTVNLNAGYGNDPVLYDSDCHRNKNPFLP